MSDTGQQRDKIETAIAAGQLWRAKEILGGRVRSCAFNADLYERFGCLLLQMGDDLQAGKFLFLSAVRREEYRRPIGLFLRRHARAGWRSLLASLPAAVRRTPWSELPAQLREDLRGAGVPERPDSEPLRVVQQTRDSPGWGSCAGVLFILVLFGVLLSVVIVYWDG